MATRDGARVLGMENLVGSLQVGMKGDIIIIDLNRPHLTPMYNAYSHLVYTVKGDDVKTALINGKVVMEDRKLLTIDEHDVMDRVNQISKRVRKSLGIA
jgi:5-methylthioadenosine/S-adenosylhomocysteine deaminase